MAKSSYLRDAIINGVYRNTTYTAPVTVYVGLCTTNPPTPTSFAELSGNGYARVAMAFSAPSSGATSNSADVLFPTVTGSDWATANGFGLFDASSGGNRLSQDALTTSRTGLVGDQLRFLAGSLTITET